MTLFFYGAVALEHDYPETSAILLQYAHDLGWKLDLNTLPAPFSFEELFGFNHHQDWVVFEVEGAQDQSQNIEPLYASYGNEMMITHYRTIAKQLGVSDVEALEFGASSAVNEAYENHPADLPIIRFVQSLLTALPDRNIVFCLDQDFENRFKCDEIVGDKSRILKEIWLTVAFGFTWPNLRLKFLGKIVDRTANRT